MWFEESVFTRSIRWPVRRAAGKRWRNGAAYFEAAGLGAPYQKAGGADAVYFCPVFESDAHGYDTRDYTKLDGRLGTNADFARVCAGAARGGHPGGAGRCVQPCGARLFGPSGTYWRSGRPARTGIGSTLTSAAIRVTTTACGTRAGGPLRACKAEPAQSGCGGIPVRLYSRLGGRNLASTACGWMWPIVWTRISCAVCAPLPAA